MKEYVDMDEFKNMCQLCFMEGENNALRSILKKDTTNFDDFFRRKILSIVTTEVK